MGSNKNFPTPQAGSHITVPSLISSQIIVSIALTTLIGVKY